MQVVSNISTEVKITFAIDEQFFKTIEIFIGLILKWHG